MLKPTEEDQTKPAELAGIDTLIAESTNPQFVADCKRFREEIRPGDEIIEFCTSLSSWRSMMGRQGYRLLRSVKAIAMVITRLN